MTMEQRKKNSGKVIIKGITTADSVLPRNTNSKNNNNNSSGNNNNNTETMKIRVKCNIQNNASCNTKDVVLNIPLSSTVYQLKEEIRSSCFNNDDGSGGGGGENHIARDRYLRLICSGRLLAPDSTGLSEFKCVKDGSVVHAVLAAPGVRGGQQAALSRDSSARRIANGNNTRRYRGIGIGASGLILPRRSNDTDDNEDDEEDIEEGRERRGFDRLRANGMSRNEIVALRAYFSTQVDRFIEQRNQLEAQNTNGTSASTSSTTDSTNDNNSNNEDPMTRRYRMEEEWMDRQGPYSEFSLNTNISNTGTTGTRSRSRSRAYINGIEIDTNTGAMNADFRSQMGGSAIGALGTNRDFVWGFVLGYSFGFMTLFFIWLPTVPHKQRVGILSGFCFQLIQNILAKSEAG